MTAPSPPFDPAALWRDMLAQWEQATNRIGGEALRSEPFAQGLHGATAAAAQGQQATHEAMRRWLAAVNMPSREEFADLSARLARIEDMLARIETSLAGNNGQVGDRPRRTRTAPPSKAAKP